MNKDQDIKILLEQYKIYVESAEKVSDRRNSANTLLLTVNSVITATLPTAKNFSDDLDAKTEFVLGFFIIIVLVLVNYFWLRLINSYRQLNTAKFKVIGEIEQRLPISPYYGMEWKELGLGLDPSKYVPLTKVEKYIPNIFIGIYLLLLFLLGISLFN